MDSFIIWYHRRREAFLLLLFQRYVPNHDHGEIIAACYMSVLYTCVKMELNWQKTIYEPAQFTHIWWWWYPILSFFEVPFTKPVSINDLYFASGWRNDTSSMKHLFNHHSWCSRFFHVIFLSGWQHMDHIFNYISSNPSMHCRLGRRFHDKCYQ